MLALFRKFVQIYKMHRLILSLLSLFFLTSACKQDLPEGILPEQAMAEVMSEVHILDGYISNMPTDSAKRVIDSLYSQLWMRYGLDSVSFTRNVDYYLGNPVLAQRTYDLVVENLEHEEKIFMRQDSLRHAVRQDSLRHIERLTRQADLTKRMIVNAASDTVEISIEEGTKRLYETSGIWHLWERNILRRPSIVETAPSKTPPQESEIQIEEPDSLTQQPDTISDKPRQLQFKPVGSSPR